MTISRYSASQQVMWHNIKTMRVLGVSLPRQLLSTMQAQVLYIYMAA